MSARLVNIARSIRPSNLLSYQHQYSKSRTNFNVVGFLPILAAALLTNSVIGECNLDNSNSERDIVYRKEDVAAHNSKENGIWVFYKDGVYDVTKFIASHPGGKDKIMLAAGKDIEPFWNVYRQHYNSKLPMELLEQMRIGSLHPEDVAAVAKTADSSDPYVKDPELAPYMIYVQRKPINAEPPGFMLSDHWITDTSAWFVRNHHPVPHIDEKTFRLTLNKAAANNSCSIRRKDSSATAVSTSSAASSDQLVEFSIDDLKTKFKQTSIVSTIQCGGNRRSGLNTVRGTSGNAWGIAGISNGKFTGVLLRDVLLACGLSDDDFDERVSPCNRVKHVVFVAVDGMEVSVPIRTAMDRYTDVLLATEMNDETIPAQHGFPLRVIVPGHAGVRNLKWVKEIRLSEEDAEGPWQRGIAYKGFGPSDKTLDGIDIDAVPTTQHPPVTSAITLPKPGDKIPVGESFTVQGYAYAGGGRAIIRVDVSIDGGKTWKTANRTEGAQQPLDRAWAWTLWECDFPPLDETGAKVEVICKATDASYNVQPDSAEGIWNLRGINNNAWHRVSAEVAAEEQEEE